MMTVAAAIIFAFAMESTAQTYLDSTESINARVEDLLGRMTMDEKIGQMMQVDLSEVQYDPSVLTRFNIGSVLSGAGSDPAAGNAAVNWADLYDTMQSWALKTRLKIPLLYGIDAVHGHSNVVGATIFPHNIGLGCTGNAALVKEAGRVTAAEVAATGIDWTFAPCIAVPRDERWGRTYEGFGETPELARLMGSSEIRGLQGDSLSGSTSILACAKHFLGDGGTAGGRDRGNTQLSEDEVRKIHLPGYMSALDSGVGSIMVSYSSLNGLNMHASKHWITDVLKNELGFKGIVISDYAGIDLLSGDYTRCVETSINAGIDMVMEAHPNAFPAAVRSLLSQGRLDTSRIDDAVQRILTAKFRLGLFERPYVDRSLLPLVGCAEHRAVARRCVRESLVLLKKKDGILPIRKNARILVAGSHADNLGFQCGGWTISWQGGSGAVTTGTTILQGIRNAAPSAQIEYSQTGVFADTSADYSIVVIGETPYAEGVGDVIDLTLSEGLVHKMKAYGAPVIVIIISGRPLVIERMLHFADVIFAAWLPGTEGEGIADMLFGDCEPVGKLSHTWPRNMSQVPINVGDADYAPLYEYGFGLTSLADSPAGSPPVCLSSIITSDGGHFELTFNKPVKDPSQSAATFSFTRNGVPFNAAARTSLKPHDSTTIVVGLGTACFISQFDEGTIEYKGGSIEAVDGGALEPFHPVRAYNWTRPMTVTIPARIEAENCTDMFGVQAEQTTDVDGGLDVPFGDGNWATYAIYVPAASTYNVFLRTASASTEGRALITCGGKHVTVPIPLTGSWQAWETTSAELDLPAGEQTLKIGASTGGFHLNWVYVGTDPTSAKENRIHPFEFGLDQNFPNPFNPSTVIRYRVSAAARVTLKIYDILGREVATLVDEFQKPGEYVAPLSAHGGVIRAGAGFRLSSGIYFYRLEAGDDSVTKKMVLVR